MLKLRDSHWGASQRDSKLRLINYTKNSQSVACCVYSLIVYMYVADETFFVFDLPNKQKDRERFMIVSADKSIVLLADTNEDKLVWLKEVRNCVEMAKHRIHTTRHTTTPSVVP